MVINNELFQVINKNYPKCSVETNLLPKQISNSNKTTSPNLFFRNLDKWFGLAVLFLAFWAPSFVVNAQNANPVPQLEPLTPYGARVVSENWKLDSIDISKIITKFIGVQYGEISKTQTIDIYLPNSGKGPFPVILVVHGGAFMGGNTYMRGDVGPALEGVNRGYAVVSVSYRLAGEATFPRAVNDVKAAIRFVKANAKKYSINPDKVALWGSSAGGNLVAMAGTTGDVNYLDGDNVENLKYSSKVQVVVDWFGPCDFLKFDKYFAESGIKPENGSVLRDDSHESWYIGQNVTKDTVFTEKANPETYISTMDVKTAPYFFIEHGVIDPTVPAQQSISLAHKLEAKLDADKVTLVLLKDAKHASPEFRTTENVNTVFNFIDKILK